MKFTPGKWILRVPCPNGECCQNFVSNTVYQVNILRFEWRFIVSFKCFTKKCLNKMEGKMIFTKIYSFT